MQGRCGRTPCLARCGYAEDPESHTVVVDDALVVVDDLSIVSHG